MCRYYEALAHSTVSDTNSADTAHPSSTILYALGAAVAGRLLSHHATVLTSRMLRHEVTHPFAEHLLRLYPARNSTAAASALLAAVETQQIDAVRLVLNHIAVRKE